MRLRGDGFTGSYSALAVIVEGEPELEGQPELQTGRHLDAEGVD